jgi:plastocyanin
MRYVRWLVLVAVAVAAVPEAHPDPRPRPRPVTAAELDRLEQRLDDQQRLIERLLRLHAQYAQQLAALLPPEGGKPGAPVEPRPGEPRDVRAEPVVEAHVTPRARPAGKAVGTVVGKVAGGGGEAFVYVEDVVAPVRATAAIKQQGKQFAPGVLAVVKGTRVDFPNLDAVFHNVFSVTPDASFDLGSYAQGGSKSVTMTKPGVVTVYCNMHPQMVGYILVTPSSLWARAGADGFYRLASVPVGHHRIVAWAPNARPVVAEVDVTDAEPATVELEVKRGRVGPHTNKDGMAYGSYRE